MVRSATRLAVPLLAAVWIFFQATPSSHDSAFAESAAAWHLVWSDEFNGTNGSAPDPRKWVYDLGGSGWGNNELQTYTSRRENVRVENGKLVIEARRENFTGADRRARGYTSARLKTKGKASWVYGRIEARIQLPSGPGIWPALWMMGDDVDQAGWPNCGEIDIMENIGREPATVHGTVHGPGYSGAGGIGKAFDLPVGERFSAGFHDFALEWEPSRLRWFVDGREYFSLTPKNLPARAKWVFDKREFLLLNVAVGGSWPGHPSSTNLFPQKMLVDFVRVYSR